MQMVNEGAYHALRTRDCFTTLGRLPQSTGPKTEMEIAQVEIPISNYLLQGLIFSICRYAAHNPSGTPSVL
jgi:hypothetical protein